MNGWNTFLKDTFSSVGNVFAAQMNNMIWMGDKFKMNWKSIGKVFTGIITQMIAKLIIFGTLNLLTSGGFGTATGGLGKFMGFITGKKEGGIVNGKGTGASDSNLVAISDGEYVVNQKQTSLFRPLLDLINFGSIKNFQAPKLAYNVGGVVDTNNYAMR